MSGPLNSVCDEYWMSKSLSKHFSVKVIRTVLLKTMALLLILDDKLTYSFFLLLRWSGFCQIADVSSITNGPA